MGFTIENISEELKKEMVLRKVWAEDYSIKIGDLRLLTVDHYNFDNEIKQGQMIVHAKVAENALKIFKELFAIRFPINQMKLMNDYEGDDALSMKENNSSCFNYRKISGSDKLSIHSYGLAIDINPLQNPCLVISQDSEMVKVEPQEGVRYLNRNNQRPGMVEPIKEIFFNNGFNIWGGNWNEPIDYHHFQVVERSRVEEWILGSTDQGVVKR